ncbi:uncharacterized protein LOC126470570 [Schistocerca serialis cubense]|uniref:uncharacterized protein LOC126470570 n=1 Tax=Schistocerca serialis cubense TaxID=2023355 RepID=UPI00214EFF88|nr:uncharacterized protein LOC126470570 [Schistocerca serialis cubense]
MRRNLLKHGFVAMPRRARFRGTVPLIQEEGVLRNATVTKFPDNNNMNNRNIARSDECGTINELNNELRKLNLIPRVQSSRGQRDCNENELVLSPSKKILNTRKESNDTLKASRRRWNLDLKLWHRLNQHQNLTSFRYNSKLFQTWVPNDELDIVSSSCYDRSEHHFSDIGERSLQPEILEQKTWYGMIKSILFKKRYVH